MMLVVGVCPAVGTFLNQNPLHRPLLCPWENSSPSLLGGGEQRARCRGAKSSPVCSAQQEVSSRFPPVTLAPNVSVQKVLLKDMFPSDSCSCGSVLCFLSSLCLHLRYIHDDSETRGDEVGLKVTDGQNSKVVVLQVQVSL